MDSIQSQLENRIQTPGRRPSALNPTDFVQFLRLSPAHTPAITWTLNLDETPIYAIRPEGDFLEETYADLVRTLDEQTTSAATAAETPPPEAGGPNKGKKTTAPPIPPPPVERMSLPGIINGQVELMNGLVVPTVRPALGAMFTWSTGALIDALDKFPSPLPPPMEDKPGTPFDPRDGLRTFLHRIYEEMRNVGLAPEDRALNFAATNAYQANDIFVKIRGRNIHIEKFEVVRSPVMRPESDCWDVKMTFYNPADLTTNPREVYFYTIDVSDVVPVAIGKPRHWTTY
jgi:PatG C-terminal